jgi:hypothetical protein
MKRHGIGICGILGLLASNCGGVDVDVDASASSSWHDAALQGIEQNANALHFRPEGCDSGYRSCAARATTWLALDANLDPTTWILPWPWNPNDPANSSAFSVTAQAYDDAGRSVILVLYFSLIAQRSWTYHVQAGSDSADFGSGHLDFDEPGALARWTEVMPMHLPSVDGDVLPVALDFGHSTASGGSGTDGITAAPGPSNVSGERADGSVGRWGFGCGSAPRRPRDLPSPDVSAPPSNAADTFAHCESQPTATVTLVGNLGTLTPVHRSPWDLRHPARTSDFSAPIAAVDGVGRLVEASVYLRREGVHVWSYHVVVDGPPALELSAGTISFDASGRLARQRVTQQLRLPGSGEGWQPVAFDFGATLHDGGDGVSGVTSLGTASYLSPVTQDGRLGELGIACDNGATRALVYYEPMPAVAAVCGDTLGLGRGQWLGSRSGSGIH